MASTVVGLYNTQAEAQQVMEALLDSGLNHNQVGLKTEASKGMADDLVKEGVPKDDADGYAKGVRQGGALVTVRADEKMTPKAVDIMNRYVDDAVAATGAGGGTKERKTVRGDNDEVIEVVEEEMNVGKREINRGGVRIRSYVTEIPVEKQVRLRDETINVERHAVDRPVTDADSTAFQEQTFEATETDEEAVVQKQARVVEEVSINKDVEERTETVRGTVRHTDVEVEEIGADRSLDKDYAQYEETFKANYQKAPFRKDYTYAQTEPAYRYGYTLANDQRYRDRDWNDIEPEARKNWEARNEGTWKTFSEPIRYSWDEARKQR